MSMRKFEYRAVPAPSTGTKARGVKTADARFALSMTNELNKMAGRGWEYVRSETLPCTERKGLTGSQQVYRNILIFRRVLQSVLPLEAAAVASAPEPELEAEDELVEDVLEEAPAEEYVEEPEESEAPALTAAHPEDGNAPAVRGERD